LRQGCESADANGVVAELVKRLFMGGAVAFGLIRSVWIQEWGGEREATKKV